ncbi:MerR family transcriptional regulator [Bacillus infantis]|jgi:DNA-binding transcriptional MerR regulator|uniref:MerR family transcriptional regulator n=1 Tax=Bacillus infantis TaxID=324767 RepID=UPI001CD58A68|nr:MerR family transcriptional regulator [Bacillus infantis]MCA1041986.1 MerR family transcriptional regulator [Bacillus infantis]
MDKYWKVGEIAEITGLSIRTLRYYDQIKLLSPSEYTKSGHRRYSHEDIQRLVEILSLKQMGFSLDDIKGLKEKDNNSTILNTLGNQIESIKSDIEIQQQLLKQLESVHDEFTNSNKDFVSLQNLTALFELMKVSQSNYFSQNQIDMMRNHYHSIDEKTLRNKEKEFTLILNKLRIKKESGASVSNSEVQSLARRWQQIIYSISPNNIEFQKNAERYYAENPDIASRVGVEPSLYKYIQDALLDS